ncbi:MAG TPA: nitronate monooxygenase, partial [Eubacteriaceae bacterium]|nr:nitronate monooxygenase [Eubacteriaceae bacterium]
TRFVASEECDAHINFKQAYVDATEEDVAIIQSPVGLPGRAIRNNFIRRLEKQNEAVDVCYNCIQTCDPKTTPYCISQALIRSVTGDVKNGLVFCGENVTRVDRIKPLKEIMEDIVQEAAEIE